MHEYNPASKLHRFSADAAHAEREARTTAFIAAVVLPLFLYAGRGERDPRLLLAFGLGTALLTYLWCRWTHHRGLSRVEVDPERIEVAGPRQRWQLRWRDVERIRHGYYGGERWTFSTRAGTTRVLRIEGFTEEERAALNEHIRAHAPSAAER